MRWLSSLESRLQWVAFPGLFKYLTFLGVIVFAWQWVDPTVVERIAFDREKILSGEFWRVLTFAFTPAGTAGFTPIGALFLFFAVMIAFLINDSLESVWGPTRTTLYILTAWICLVLGMFIFDPGTLSAGRYIYTSMFLAFATYFPNYEFRLFFFIPVKVRFLGWLALGMMIFSAIATPILLCVVVPTLIPYLLWVLPAEIRGQATLAKAAKRRQQFTLAKKSDAEAFHSCATCKRTEHDDDDLQFRVMPDGTEYCIEHLPVDDTTAK
ncbi:hypothetical protein ACFQY0_14655 [Haloferula chungangensis]|uniref:Rhomboid family intramembrane serine protease n=1 Tax=Haloferula chungangensis TaxID=1048331 RepID=A0ABW2LBT2_9BACT